MKMYAGPRVSKVSDPWSSAEFVIWLLILSVFQVLIYMGPCQRSLQDQWFPLLADSFLKCTSDILQTPLWAIGSLARLSKAQNHILSGIILWLLHFTESIWNSISCFRFDYLYRTAILMNCLMLLEITENTRVFSLLLALSRIRSNGSFYSVVLSALGFLSDSVAPP